MTNKKWLEEKREKTWFSFKSKGKAHVWTIDPQENTVKFETVLSESKQFPHNYNINTVNHSDPW